MLPAAFHRHGWLLILALVAGTLSSHAADASRRADGNRLAYLESDDPFYPNRHFPKLITPQWVGEPGVEAVVILAIDDMRDSKKYEAWLRPVLERLKKIDGRAPVSIFANVVEPADPQLQTWLKEGLSLEVHTLSHPCPLLQAGSFTNAWDTYHDCVDLLNRVAGNKPVAFRMPCCDSMNSPSPRFYAEIFSRPSLAGNFLQIDSSVMCLLTDGGTPSSSSTLPGERGQGVNSNRFAKYFPALTNSITKKSLSNFATWIEDYPYPYVIGRTCWEFPAMVPSDWEAFNTHGATNPVTLADWKAALDITVRKQGVFTWIFHPHGWSTPEQIIDFIDHAQKTHGKKVKFLTFKEALERLNKNLLSGTQLREARRGDNYGDRLLDLNNDGFMDVLIATRYPTVQRLWNSKTVHWEERPLPFQPIFPVQESNGREARFGILHEDGRPTIFYNLLATNFHAFDFQPDGRWVERTMAHPAITLPYSLPGSADQGCRFRDLDHDGICELIVANPKFQAVYGWSEPEQSWKEMPNAWPKGVGLVNDHGEENGVRFADLNGDGYEDLILSNEERFGVWLYIAAPKPNLGIDRGWTFQVRDEKRAATSTSGGTTSGSPKSLEIPPFVRSGPHRNNGAWFHAGQLWIQNEDTAHLPDNVIRLTFQELMAGGEPPPLSPADSLAAMQIRPGFQAELVAGEPLVLDPVAFEWGADGRLWVVEMADYPLGLDGRGKSGGRVVTLEDTDGDGRYDKRTVFLDGLNFPNGVMPWRNGILVSTAPDIIYAEDTNGDGRADVKKVLITGFREGNQQHRINGFDYGLDNWVYAANGESGGSIRRVGGVMADPTSSPLPSDRVGVRGLAENPPIDIRGYDIRFHPDSGELDLVAGPTQFGRHRDDYGNWFGNNNPTWLWHYQIPVQYLTRNPVLSVRLTRTILANYTPPNDVFTAGRTQPRFNWADRVNQVTSANSATPYRDELFGPAYATSVFISEPANNVVHREILEPDGATFKSHRADDEQRREFIASADKWFRPTMLKTGPDGALYIADMYRLVIEHPEYFPEEIKTRPDLRAGDDKGRIWRVYPVGVKPRAIPRLDRLDPIGLVASLDSPSGWQRDTVQRLLVERADRSAITPLQKLASTAGTPKTRLQALCTLDGLHTLTAPLLIAALTDSNSFVREHALRLSEPLLRTPGTNDALRSAVLGQLDRAKTDRRLAHQLALTLGELPPDDSPTGPGPALASIALAHFADPPLRVAVLSSIRPHVGHMIPHVLARNSGPIPDGLVEQLCISLGTFGTPGEIRGVLRPVLDPAGAATEALRFETVASLSDALDRRNVRLETQLDADTAKLVEITYQKARETAALGRESAGTVAALRLLGRQANQRPADQATLVSLLSAKYSAATQSASLAALNRIGSRDGGDLLVAAWPRMGPGIRPLVLDALLTRSEWIQSLLGAVEKGSLAAGEIGTVAQQKLLKNPQTAVRERATRLFVATNPDRQKVVKEYESVLTLNADASRGAPFFAKNCAACHRLGGAGNSVGPDLGSMADKPVASLVVAILDPSQAVDPAYTAYTSITRQEREITGIIAAESPNSITLRNAGGVDETILRADLRELRGSRLSLMPEGFEKALTPQDLADLIAWIKSPPAKP